MSTKYLRNKRITTARAIYRMLKRWKSEFVVLLRKQEKKSAFYEVKADFIDEFLKDIRPELPDFLKDELPTVMKKWAAPQIAKYKDVLPQGYSLAFDLPTSPASNHVRELVDLHLSVRDGSTLKTTRDELRRIVADGIDKWSSYSEIADQIEELDPFVFSASRAKLIAVNEVGRAYGFANFEPARVLSENYVMEKVWDTKWDALVREEHLQNEDDGWIPLDQPFSWTWDMFAPSEDFNCRCTGSDRIVGIKTADGIVEVKSLAEVIQRKNNFCNCKSWV